MPDLPGRAKFERQLTEELSKVLTSAQRTLVDALWQRDMTQAQLATMPPSVATTLENELARALEITLTEAYIKAVESFADEMKFGIDKDAIDSAALEWAVDYSRTLARDLVARRRSKLSEIANRAPDVVLQKRDLINLLSLALSLAGASTIAVTSISDTLVNGETFVQQRLEENNVTVEPIYFTQLDERVCVFCAPLHGIPASDSRYKEPPLHPNCRCYKGYKITSSDGSVQILFDDDKIRRQLRGNLS